MTDATLTAVLSSTWPEVAPETVVLLLHGYGSQERDLPGIAGWLPEGMPWASLRAPLTLGPGAYAWFPLTPDGGMDDAAIRAAVEAVWAWVDAHLAPGATVIPVGFSQGGLMALELLRSRPTRVLAPVLLAGFAGAEQREGDAVLADARPAVFWGRGDADPVIWADALERTRVFLAGHASAEVHTYPGLGHAVTHEELDDMRDFLVQAVAR